jgi:hypothetical protein
MEGFILHAVSIETFLGFGGSYRSWKDRTKYVLAALSPSELSMIMRGNAKRLFQFEG